MQQQRISPTCRVFVSLGQARSRGLACKIVVPSKEADLTVLDTGVLPIAMGSYSLLKSAQITLNDV